VDENYIWSIINQVAAALKYCHFGLQKDSSAGDTSQAESPTWTVILHRDIKPGNSEPLPDILAYKKLICIVLFSSQSRTARDCVKIADLA
jgi:serine/threonine protein kinase